MNLSSLYTLHEREHNSEEDTSLKSMATYWLEKSSNVKLNENKSGVFVNLSFLPHDTIDEIQNYLNYIQDQESSLVFLENQKEEFKNIFFASSE
jgi:hypothetical protein